MYASGNYKQNLNYFPSWYEVTTENSNIWTNHMEE